MNQLLNGVFPLLGNPDLKVINAYQMRHQMGGETLGNMGYVIIDGAGLVRELVVNPLFGQDAGKIIESLKALQ